MIIKFYKTIFTAALIVFTISTFTTGVFAGTDLKLNPNLNYSGDSNDGPLIPSRRLCSPARSTLEIWTNASLEPSLGSMNPKPFVGLNHLTVPVAMAIPFAQLAV